MSLYLDSSGLVKTVINESGSIEMVEEIGRHNVHFTARISLAEVCAALARAQRMGRLSISDLEACIADFLRHWPSLERVAITEDIVREAADLAVRFGLRGYDAVQLSAGVRVAHAGPLMFAAWDVRLRTAAQALGLSLFPAIV